MIQDKIWLRLFSTEYCSINLVLKNQKNLCTQKDLLNTLQKEITTSAETEYRDPQAKTAKSLGDQGL